MPRGKAKKAVKKAVKKRVVKAPKAPKAKELQVARRSDGFFSVLARVNSGNGRPILQTYEEAERTARVSQWFQTGIYPLDLSLGGKGVPLGRVLEIFGDEGTLKTAVCLKICNAVGRAGGVIFHNDQEHALSEEFLRAEPYIRVDDRDLEDPNKAPGPINFIPITPNYLEGLRAASIQIMREFRREYPIDRADPSKTVPAIMVFDSVASFASKQELHEDDKKGKPTEREAREYPIVAKIMSSWLRELVWLVSEFQFTVVFVNQLRQKLNASMFEDPYITCGGRALKYYTTYRIYLQGKSFIRWKVKGADERAKPKPVGFTVRGKLVKNKINPEPPQEFKIPCFYSYGIHPAWCALELFEQFGRVKLAGRTRRIPMVSAADGWTSEADWLKYAERNWKKIAALIEKLMSRYTQQSSGAVWMPQTHAPVEDEPEPALEVEPVGEEEGVVDADFLPVEYEDHEEEEEER